MSTQQRWFLRLVSAVMLLLGMVGLNLLLRQAGWYVFFPSSWDLTRAFRLLFSFDEWTYPSSLAVWIPLTVAFLTFYKSLAK